MRSWRPKTQRRAETAFWAIFLLIAGVAAPRDANAAYVDYIYVNANEGQASGGHVGIAFGGQTFHFQYRDGGLILPTRHASGDFERIYRVQGNRDLRIHRIQVDDETYAMLRDGFNAHYFESEVALSELQRLAEERERLLAANAGEQSIAVPGAGFFYPDGGEPARTEAAAPLARLSSRLAREKKPAPSEMARRDGADWLADQLSRTALEQGAILRPSATFAAGRPETVLGANSRASLRVLLQQFEAQVRSLLESSRPDAGEARFLAMARYAAVSRSLEYGRLMVLDAFPPDAETISVAEIQARGGRLEELLEATRSEFTRAWALLGARESPDETDYSRLEDAANRLREVEQAQHEGRKLRIVDARMIPQRPARRSAGDVSPLRANNREAALARNKARTDVIRGELRVESAYNLLTRNCVSEIFRTVEELLAGDGTDAAVSRATARLGGHISGNRAMNFIPFVASDAVSDQYRVSQTIELSSHRGRALAKIYSREGNGLAVYLREANTLTSTIYRRNAADSIFLFFTDDVFAPRPVYGALNLLAGIGAAFAGIPMLPFDGGRLFSAGARGALWSLPELAFANVRKGSFFFVPDPPQEKHLSNPSAPRHFEPE